MMMKSGLKSFYFEVHWAASEIPANLSGQFSFSGQIVLHWPAATQFKSKVSISRLEILVRLLKEF